jgi:hypothetical protein
MALMGHFFIFTSQLSQCFTLLPNDQYYYEKSFVGPNPITKNPRHFVDSEIVKLSFFFFILDLGHL